MVNVYHIPFSEVLKYVSIFCNDTIVSVGCGPGTIEYDLRENGIKNMILVDPEPESFRKYPENGRCIKPDYPTVKKLLKHKRDIKGECVLFLSWPSPNSSHYDIDAINMLNPKAVVLIYETNGAAGGMLLHTWLEEIMWIHDKNEHSHRISYDTLWSHIGGGQENINQLLNYEILCSYTVKITQKEPYMNPGQLLNNGVLCGHVTRERCPSIALIVRGDQKINYRIKK